MDLIGFENLSGMKINFSKCDMISLNISDTEANSLASLICCKVGSFFYLPGYSTTLGKIEFSGKN